MEMVTNNDHLLELFVREAVRVRGRGKSGVTPPSLPAGIHGAHHQESAARPLAGALEFGAGVLAAVQATKVRQRWEGMRGCRPGAGRLGRYLRTVRGDPRRPSVSSSSLARRSSPQEGLSRAIRRMSPCNSVGSGGRPDRDFPRQNRRNPWRCQRVNVAGCTMTRA